MASLAKFIWSSLRRIYTSDDGSSASSSRTATATTSRVEGPSTTGVPCSPESCVGFLAAVAEPASTNLRIASKHIRSRNYGIMTVGTDQSGITLETRTFPVNRPCGRCSRRVGGARVYMLSLRFLMDMMFCSRNCRFDYFMEALYNQRHIELTGLPAGDQISTTMKELLVSRQEKANFREAFFSG